MDYITKDNLKYAIVAKDETHVSIHVAYWGEGFTVRADQCISLPIDPVTFIIPSGQVLADLIIANAPLEHLNKEVERYKRGVLVDFTEIDKLITEGASQIPKLTNL